MSRASTAVLTSHAQGRVTRSSACLMAAGSDAATGLGAAGKSSTANAKMLRFPPSASTPSSTPARVIVIPAGSARKGGGSAASAMVTSLGGEGAADSAAGKQRSPTAASLASPTSPNASSRFMSPTIPTRTIVIQPSSLESPAKLSTPGIAGSLGRCGDTLHAENSDGGVHHHHAVNNDGSEAMYAGPAGMGGGGPHGGNIQYVSGGGGDCGASVGGRGYNVMAAGGAGVQAQQHHHLQGAYYSPENHYVNHTGGNNSYYVNQIGNTNGNVYQQSADQLNGADGGVSDNNYIGGGGSQSIGCLGSGPGSGSLGGILPDHHGISRSGGLISSGDLKADQDAAAQHLTHTTRASPATIQWLIQNYETADGVSLPRCTLYNHYLKHCQQNRLDPVNAASFGKLIRSVFLGLRTRRLGTRGNSKYHYYGIRIKPESHLHRLSDDSLTMAMRQQPLGHRHSKIANMPPQRSNNENVNNDNTNETNLDSYPHPQGDEGAQLNNPSVHQQLPPAHDNSAPSNGGVMMQQHAGNVGAGGTLNPPANAQVPHSAHAQQQAANQPSAVSMGSTAVPTQLAPEVAQYREHLGQPQFPGQVPLPTADQHLRSIMMEIRLSLNSVPLFCEAYSQHCKEILMLIQDLRFKEVEACWQRFWQPSMPNHQHGALLGRDEQDMEPTNPAGLTRIQLYSLCSCQTMLDYLCTMDLHFYECLVKVLIPNVLSTIPNALTQMIRNFAKGLEVTMANCLIGAPETLLHLKTKVVGSFAQTLRRYTSLSHLAQAARGVLQNSTQVQLMIQDLNRVNFKDIQDQASFICRCEDSTVELLESGFKRQLSQRSTLEQWASWLEGVVDQMLLSRQGADNLYHAARQFLLKWSFYSSMVIRDLTLRSASSFGSFHLIRLLYDEYMFYLVENRIARTTGQTALGVVSQLEQNSLSRFNSLGGVTASSHGLCLPSPGVSSLVNGHPSSSIGGGSSVGCTPCDMVPPVSYFDVVAVNRGPQGLSLSSSGNGASSSSALYGGLGGGTMEVLTPPAEYGEHSGAIHQMGSSAMIDHDAPSVGLLVGGEGNPVSSRGCGGGMLCVSSGSRPSPPSALHLIGNLPHCSNGNEPLNQFSACPASVYSSIAMVSSAGGGSGGLLGGVGPEICGGVVEVTTSLGTPQVTSLAVSSPSELLLVGGGTLGANSDRGELGGGRRSSSIDADGGMLGDDDSDDQDDSDMYLDGIGGVGESNFDVETSMRECSGDSGMEMQSPGVRPSFMGKPDSAGEGESQNKFPPISVEICGNGDDHGNPEGSGGLNGGGSCGKFEFNDNILAVKDTHDYARNGADGHYASGDRKYGCDVEFNKSSSGEIASSNDGCPSDMVRFCNRSNGTSAGVDRTTAAAKADNCGTNRGPGPNGTVVNNYVKMGASRQRHTSSNNCAESLQQRDAGNPGGESKRIKLS